MDYVWVNMGLGFWCFVSLLKHDVLFGTNHSFYYHVTMWSCNQCNRTVIFLDHAGIAAWCFRGGCIRYWRICHSFHDRKFSSPAFVWHDGIPNGFPQTLFDMQGEEDPKESRQEVRTLLFWRASPRYVCCWIAMPAIFPPACKTLLSGISEITQVLWYVLRAIFRMVGLPQPELWGFWERQGVWWSRRSSRFNIPLGQAWHCNCSAYILLIQSGLVGQAGLVL